MRVLMPVLLVQCVCAPCALHVRGASGKWPLGTSAGWPASFTGAAGRNTLQFDVVLAAQHGG